MKPPTNQAPEPTFKPTKYKRKGGITKQEQALVTQFVKDQPTEITTGQIRGLAQTLRRTPDTVKVMILKAREQFVQSASDYVDIHKRATEGALESEDYETAAKASQWALSNLSAEGERLIERTEIEAQGTKIVIGVALGGTKEQNTTPVIDAVKVSHE
jgi:hypothetical protein